MLASFEIILSAEQDKMRNNVKGQMDLFSLDGAESLNDDGFKYPEMKEFSQKELLLFEKEASGMYFSGHMIDSFSRHIEKLRVDRISDIINDMNEENFAENKRYKDKMKVSIAGVITAKRTKALKNGDTMAFISVEDKLSEIEVIVFAKQYSRFLDLIIEDNAVYIEGNISEEEGDAPKILLSNVLNLKSNSDVLREEELAAKKPERKKSLYVKVDGLSDKRLEQLMRASIINPGDTAVVVFDKRTKKYSAMKDTSINPTESVILKLKKLFGEDGVVLS